ncbi:hypothetical protein ACRAWF_39965 [Streptomyces sp. L7]
MTGSGKRAVVVYAPRDFTNEPELMEHGAFAAVVDLTSGKVTKLADTVTLAYFDPGLRDRRDRRPRRSVTTRTTGPGC